MDLGPNLRCPGVGVPGAGYKHFHTLSSPHNMVPQCLASPGATLERALAGVSRDCPCLLVTWITACWEQGQVAQKKLAPWRE